VGYGSAINPAESLFNIAGEIGWRMDGWMENPLAWIVEIAAVLDLGN
jgi:hypothetical protein